MNRDHYRSAKAITPSDATNIAGGALTDAVWVGGAGIVVAVMGDDSTVNFTCAAGTLLPVQVKRVNATSTTATLMVALWK